MPCPPPKVGWLAIKSPDTAEEVNVLAGIGWFLDSDPHPHKIILDQRIMQLLHQIDRSSSRVDIPRAVASIFIAHSKALRTAAITEESSRP